MADILKISTPVPEKMMVQHQKAAAEPNLQFPLTDLERVIAPNQQNDILGQNHGMVDRDASPSILMDLLKDPSVTVGFLKNIFMLEEIIKLIPVNNATLTQEIQNLFDALLVSPDDVVGELLRQAQGSTAFHGEVFDHLRQLLQGGERMDLRMGIANLLKAINGSMSRQSILHSLSNSLLFLSDSLQSSAALSEKLLDMAAAFREGDAQSRFAQLKQDTLALLDEVRSSILFSPKIEKLLPMITYNLSRYQDNADFLQEATTRLLTLIDGEGNKQKLAQTLYSFFAQQSDKILDNSQVMSVLSQIIEKHVEAGRAGELELMPGRLVDAENVQLLGTDKVDKIVQSLLSSPCNFTPLLHFIVPVLDGDIRAFAELWIDPNDETGGGKKAGDGDYVHMLIVFDVEGLGRFEAELFVRNKEISMALLCPPAYVEAFSKIETDVARAASERGYRFKELMFARLEKQRSLMEVFKTLPHRRAGVDMKV